MTASSFFITLIARMLIEERNALGELKYSISVSLNHIDLSEYTDIEGDYGHIWEIVMINVPAINNDTDLKEIQHLIHELINPNGEPIEEVKVDKEVRSLVNHYLMTF